MRPAASFSITSGEFWGDFAGGPEGPIELQLPSRSTPTRLETVADGDPAKFKVTVLDDKSTAVAIYRGKAQVTTGEQVVAVKAHEYVVIDTSGTASQPKRLLEAPDAVEPRPGERHSYREFPPAVAFAWRAVRGAEEYRITIAKDENFRHVDLDERTNQTSYSIGNLTKGKYWWTVTSIRGGVDGNPSQPRTFTMIEDRVAPVLRVTRAEARTHEAKLVLEGVSEPGARVFVGGAPATVQDDGRFSFVTPLQPGVNLVVVEAVDAVGNAAYRSQEVHRVLDGGKSAP
jgi:hypothetical protein